MTEINRDRLTRLSEVSSSSDEAILNNLKDMQRDYRGIPDPEVVLDGELLQPYANYDNDLKNYTEASSEINKKTVDYSDLKPSDSGFAKLIWAKRPQSKKKAA